MKSLNFGMFIIRKLRFVFKLQTVNPNIFIVKWRMQEIAKMLSFMSCIIFAIIASPLHADNVGTIEFYYQIGNGIPDNFFFSIVFY